MNYVTEHPLLITTIICGAILLTLGWAIFDLRSKWAAMFGKRPADDALTDAMRRLVDLEQSVATIKPRLKSVEAMSEVTIQKVGFLRFNPFERTGGDQSFALALLDQSNNGVVISSLYTRDGVRVYAKEIQSGNPRQQLSEEETKVLNEAISKS